MLHVLHHIVGPHSLRWLAQMPTLGTWGDYVMNLMLCTKISWLLAGESIEMTLLQT